MRSRIEMIGSPIAHVRTPSRLHQLFEKTGEAIRVTVREVTTAELAGYMAEARRDDELIGLVVTMPVKTLICSHLARRTELVELMGSSNCVRFDPGGPFGANFDGIGCIKALRDAGHDPAGKTILLIGCGGAGKSIAASLVKGGAKSLHIIDLAVNETSAFVRWLRTASPDCAISLHDLGAERCEIVINASPLGMKDGDPSPVPREVVARCEAVLDIAYHPPVESLLSREARVLGKAFIDGVLMVEAQTALFRSFLLSSVESEDDAVLIAGGADPPAYSSRGLG